MVWQMPSLFCFTLFKQYHNNRAYFSTYSYTDVATDPSLQFTE